MRAYAIVALCVLGTAAWAEPPVIQTQGTVIYLSDNLDEVDRLGWCIDTLGRGFAEQLQAHSCKPQGGDVQFGYNSATQQIYSVEFEGKCMAHLDPINPHVPFWLEDCNDVAHQRFDIEDGRIFLVEDPQTCVVVGETSRMAGPFMSRDLTKAPCDTVDPLRAIWMVRD